MKKITVITVCYNAAQTIERTIKSVLSQSVKDYEYIIIDGASSDGTLKIVDKYRQQLSRVVSEPDKGIYDAMNKGVRFATGEYIHFLNADDYYVDTQVLQRVLGSLLEQQVYYGNIIKYDADGMIRRVGGPFSLSAETAYPHYVNQPGMFVPLACYKKVGEFNLNYPIAADFDMTVRLVQKFPCKYLGLDVVAMPAGGMSDVHAIKGYKEVRSIAISHGKCRLVAQLNFMLISTKELIKAKFPKAFFLMKKLLRNSTILSR